MPTNIAIKTINADFGKWSAYEKGDFTCGELVLVDGKTYSGNEEMEYCLHPSMMKFIFEDSYDRFESEEDPNTVHRVYTVFISLNNEYMFLDDEDIVLYDSIGQGAVPQLEEELTRRGLEFEWCTECMLDVEASFSDLKNIFLSLGMANGTEEDM